MSKRGKTKISTTTIIIICGTMLIILDQIKDVVIALIKYAE